MAGWIVYFDTMCIPSDLVSYLTEPIQKITKFVPIFEFGASECTPEVKNKLLLPNGQLLKRKKTRR